MTPEEYEAKRQRRIDRLEERAAAKRSEGEAATRAGDAMLSVIPLGQPILVGHHSEGRDRRYRGRAFGKLERGRELTSEAERLEQRAAAASENTAIFSDDPAAVEKLEAKVERLEARQRLMVAANRCVKRGDREGLAALGFSPSRIQELFTPDFCGRLGFPGYALTNNGTNIRRLKGRVGELVRAATESTTETERNGVRVVDDVDANRLRLYFPGKPAEAVRDRLKRSGFRWSPPEGCWQRHRGSSALAAADYALDLTSP